jgi:hypothetical protein
MQNKIGYNVDGVYFVNDFFLAFYKSEEISAVTGPRLPLAGSICKLYANSKEITNTMPIFPSKKSEAYVNKNPNLSQGTVSLR